MLLTIIRHDQAGPHIDICPAAVKVEHQVGLREDVGADPMGDALRDRTIGTAREDPVQIVIPVVQRIATLALLVGRVVQGGNADDRAAQSARVDAVDEIEQRGVPLGLIPMGAAVEQQAGTLTPPSMRIVWIAMSLPSIRFEIG